MGFEIVYMWQSLGKFYWHFLALLFSIFNRFLLFESLLKHG